MIFVFSTKGVHEIENGEGSLHLHPSIVLDEIAEEINQIDNQLRQCLAECVKRTTELETELSIILEGPPVRPYKSLEEWFRRPFTAAVKKDNQTEDYMPKPYMSEEERMEYANEIFFKVVLNPDSIDEYQAIFTESSIEAVKRVNWVYAFPEKMYEEEQVRTIPCYEYGSNKGYIHYFTVIDIRIEYYIYPDVREEMEEKMDNTLVPDLSMEVIERVFGNENPAEVYDVYTGFWWIYEESTGLIQISGIYVGRPQ